MKLLETKERGTAEGKKRLGKIVSLKGQDQFIIPQILVYKYKFAKRVAYN